MQNEKSAATVDNRPKIDLFDAMFSMRAMRRLKPDPLPRELIEELLLAATQAPSGQNTQAWAFLVLTDPEAKAFYGSRYQHWLRKLMGGAIPDEDDMSQRAREMRAALYLADHMSEAPAIVLALGKRDWPFRVATADRVGLAPPSYGSVYPAVQNLLLACRAHGLGASLTTMHQMFEDELIERFDIPQTHGIVAGIPIGYPLGNFGPVRRKPVAQVAHFNRWQADH